MERILNNITSHYTGIICLLIFMAVWFLGITGGVFVMFKHPELLNKLLIFQLTKLKTPNEITKFDLYRLKEAEKFANIDEKTKKVMIILILAFGAFGLLFCLFCLALAIFAY